LVYAKKSFSQDLSVKTMCSVLCLLFFPRLSYRLGIRLRGDVIDFFQHFTHEIIKRKKQDLKSNSSDSSKASCFLDLLIEAEEESKRMESAGEEVSKKQTKHMSHDEMIAQCILFFLAG